MSHISCFVFWVAPGTWSATAYFWSKAWISSSFNFILRNSLSSFAFACLMAGLNDLRGFPSIEILTKLSIRANFGLMSDKLLFDIFRVLRWYRFVTVSGNLSSLLLCRSKTERFGERSKFESVDNWLKASKIWSSLGAFGTLSKLTKLFWWRSSISRFVSGASASFSISAIRFFASDKSVNFTKNEICSGTIFKLFSSRFNLKSLSNLPNDEGKASS